MHALGREAGTRRAGLPARLVAWLPPLAVLASFATAVAAAPPKKLEPVYPIQETMEVDPHLEIVVAPPGISLRSYKVRRKQRQPTLPTREIADWIHRTEVTALQQRGFAVRTEDTEAADGLANLVAASERLVRGRTPTEEGAAVLRAACGGGEGSAILAQHLKVKAAPQGTWDALSGGMTVGMSNSNLRGALFDCRTQERLWEGEMYIRMLPEPGNTRFEAAVVGIFTNLEKGND